MSILRRTLSKLSPSKVIFEFFQRLGWHILRRNFYSPLPDTRLLKSNNKLWEGEIELVGVDLNPEGQLNLLKRVFPQFSQECNFPYEPTSTPFEYYTHNRVFGFLSAAVLHCMVRHFAPKTIIEVGSGYSTLVSARAVLHNQAEGKTCKLISIEPYPDKVLMEGFPGLSELIPRKVEEMNLNFFNQLEEGDILFIDSSHVVRIGGDIVYLYLEVLPRLKKGVVIHIHDIFFPKHYPKDWVTEKLRFWSEQYLLQAFLTYNRSFEVLWCASYINRKYPQKLKVTFPLPQGYTANDYYSSSSFWMRKIE